VKRNILVTGGAGFIGSHLVERLLAEGIWQISVVDNFNGFYSPQIKRASIEKHLDSPDFSLYEIDICQRENLRRAFAENKFDAIVHLAAWAGVRPSLENPAIYVQTNVDGTLNLLDLAKEYGVKQFVLARRVRFTESIAKFLFPKKIRFPNRFRLTRRPKRRAN